MQNFFNNFPNRFKVILAIGFGIGMVLGVVNTDILSTFNQSPQEETENSIEVKFIMQEENKQPIEGVRVQFIFDGAPEPRITNTDGYVRINIPKRNDIDVVISKEGFKTITKTINLKADLNRTRSYILKRKILNKEKDSSNLPNIEQAITSENPLSEQQKESIAISKKIHNNHNQLPYDYNFNYILAREIEPEDSVAAIAVSHSGQYIVSVEIDRFKEKIGIWNLNTEKLDRKFENKKSSGSFSTVVISPDEKYIITGHERNIFGDDERNIRVRDLETGKLEATFKGNERGVNDLAINLNGNYVISSSNYENKIEIWNFDTKKLEKTIYAENPVFDIVISPDGQHIISSEFNSVDALSKIKVWNLDTGKLETTLENRDVNNDFHLDKRANLAVSPNGKHIVASNNRYIWIWSLETRKLEHILEGHEDYIGDVAVSSDGRFIVSGSRDKTLKIWDLNTGELIHTIEGSSRQIKYVAISFDGKHIVSGDYRTIKIWSLETENS